MLSIEVSTDFLKYFLIFLTAIPGSLRVIILQYRQKVDRSAADWWQSYR